jgi:diguanylate cyclase
MPSRRWRRRGSVLFASYLVASLVPISVIGAVAVQGYNKTGLEYVRDQARAQAAVIEEMAIAPALRGVDLSEGLNTAERARLEAATDLAVFKGSVRHLRLRSFAGTVEFSDDGRVEGIVPVDDAAFRAAAAGGTDVRIIEADQKPDSVIRVVRPVIASANGKAVGVLVVYLPYEAIATTVQDRTRRETARLAFSLVGLFAVLALISWWTTRALRQHADTHEYQSLHDSLTGLPNRELFRIRMEDALARGRRGEHGAFVLIDLDHFKEVNDTLGHHAGDELLRVVGRRLRDSLRTDDTVARLGGDEFGMVLPRGGGREETLALLTRVRHELGEEVILEGVSVSVEASFGVCFYPEGAETVEDLLQHADSAMYLGKTGQGGIMVYESTTPHHGTHALELQRELRQAVTRNELVLHYQPKLELGSGQVNCLEALVRWQHPDRGLLLPAEFLPVAERCAVIDSLTTWVLRRALADYTAWSAAGHDWTVAVNISARNLRSLGFADTVDRILQEAGVPPNRLHLEITETALALDAKLAMRVVEALADLGVSMSIDHYGVRFTGLAQLFTANISEIKIDRTFLTDLRDNEQDRAIVRSVVDIGHSLGCAVTAHGVESQDVLSYLIEAGCDQAQGYLWLRPCLWTEVARVFGNTTGPTNTISANAASGGSAKQSPPQQAGLRSKGA